MSMLTSEDQKTVRSEKRALRFNIMSVRENCDSLMNVQKPLSIMIKIKTDQVLKCFSTLRVYRPLMLIGL